jgi:hypothetical protein
VTGTAPHTSRTCIRVVRLLLVLVLLLILPGSIRRVLVIVTRLLTANLAGDIGPTAAAAAAAAAST